MNIPDDIDLQELARNLKCPLGNFGVDLAEKMNRGNLYINRYTIEALKLAPNTRCLEVGMGNGYFIDSIFHKYGSSISYYGLDHSGDMIEQASALNQERVGSGQVMFHEGRVEDMPFLENHFDTVFSVNTLYFWSDVDHTLQQIKKVLIQQGKLLLAIRPKSLMETYPMVKHGFKMYEETEIANFLKDAGFQNVEMTYHEEPVQEVYGQMLSKSALIISAVKP